MVAVLAINFTLIHAAPGDPASVIAGEMGGGDQAVIDSIKKAYGLDKPLPEQFITYIGKSVRGDLGMSYTYNKPVSSLIADRIGPTILLVLTALLVAIVVGTLLGVFASLKPKSFSSAVDVLHHLVLPALTLTLVYLAQYSRLARASMLEVLSSDYVRTAKAKGLHQGVVVFKHALRNALMPLVTIAGLQFGNLVSGAVLVETVFSWPGLGTLALDAILGRDYPTLLGVLTFSSLFVITANLLTDLSYRWIDPRLRGK